MRFKPGRQVLTAVAKYSLAVRVSTVCTNSKTVIMRPRVRSKKSPALAEGRLEPRMTSERLEKLLPAPIHEIDCRYELGRANTLRVSRPARWVPGCTRVPKARYDFRAAAVRAQLGGARPALVCIRLHFVEDVASCAFEAVSR